MLLPYTLSILLFMLCISPLLASMLTALSSRTVWHAPFQMRKIVPF